MQYLPMVAAPAKKDKQMGIWLGVAVATALVVVLVSRALARRQFAVGRQAIPLDELAGQFDGELSADIIKEVWTAVGAAYDIDPKLLRPTDNLKQLAEIDSWDLGRGGDRLDDWLKEKQLEGKPQNTTIKDLAIWVQSSTRSLPQ